MSDKIRVERRTVSLAETTPVTNDLGKVVGRKVIFQTLQEPTWRVAWQRQMPQEFPRGAEVEVPLFTLVQKEDETEVIQRITNELVRLKGDYKITVITCGSLVGFLGHTGSLQRVVVDPPAKAPAAEEKSAS